MSASPRVSVDQIKAVLEKTQGNLSESARRLGMKPNNLRARVERACIDLEALRAPAREARGLRVIVRLPEDLHEQMREAAFDLAFRRRREHTAEEVLAEFAREAFAGWLASKIERNA